MSYPSDLTDDQWERLEPVFNAPGKRGRKHGDDLRTVMDAMPYMAQTGCQWRYLPQSYGPWTRIWSQFRRWSGNGTWARALMVLHAAAREADGRTDRIPSMVVIDTHLARGASNGGTIHDRGGPFGPTNHVVTAAAARTLSRAHDLAVRRVGWDDKQPTFRPIRHACVSRWLTSGRSRRLAKSFENTTPRDRMAPGRLHRHHAAPPVPRGPAGAKRHSPRDRPPSNRTKGGMSGCSCRRSVLSYANGQGRCWRAGS